MNNNYVILFCNSVQALKDSGIKIDLQIETDVKNLKREFSLLDKKMVIVFFCYFAEFFEDCIAEEQYEAQKLDIMRDALRSKATYNIESKKIEESEKNFEPDITSEPHHHEENGMKNETKENGSVPKENGIQENGSVPNGEAQ